MSRTERRAAVTQAITAHGVSERQACVLFGLSRSSYRYRPQPRADEPALCQTLRQLAVAHPRWGVSKMSAFIRRQGTVVNFKRLWRLYCDLGLNLRVKPKKRLPRRIAQPLAVPAQANYCWSIDFMNDSLQNGRPFRTFNVLDDFNRAAVGIAVDTSFPAVRVQRVLDDLARAHGGYPQRLRLDNGPEFLAHTFATWAQAHQVQLDFIQPGKPAQNAYIERFNRTFREEVLNAYVFSSLAEVRLITEAWLQDYNGMRPHEALGGVPPLAYAPSPP